ncbi:unnamed protein product [Vicia faba]|uniref:Uncharacterized protein n=1 Tax=Vicia faba TaxID=3906 RepID=A0AAV1B238_VICFA|nr:unnamed protein product [Vicia faba]
MFMLLNIFTVLVLTSLLSIPLEDIHTRLRSKLTLIHQSPLLLKNLIPSSLLDKELYLAATCCNYQLKITLYTNTITSFLTLKTLTSMCLSRIGGKSFGSSSVVNSLKSFSIPNTSFGILFSLL